MNTFKPVQMIWTGFLLPAIHPFLEPTIPFSKSRKLLTY